MPEPKRIDAADPPSIAPNPSSRSFLEPAFCLLSSVFRFRLLPRLCCPALFAVICCVADAGAGKPTTEEEALTRAATVVQMELELLDSDVAKAAATAAKEGLDTTETRSALAAVIGKKTVVDCCTVDAKGRIAAMEPLSQKKAEGSDISNQPHAKQLRATGKPFLSGLFKAPEGFSAVELGYPVAAKGNGPQRPASVSAVFKPAEFIGGAVAPVLEGTSFTCCVMQDDGVILYGPDRADVGLNVLSDARFKPFPELQAFCKRVAANPAGEGSYRFTHPTTKSVVEKHARWRTVSLHSRQWRVAVLTK